MMRAPGFWWKPEKTFPALCLAPLSWLYSAIAERRMRKAGAAVGIPVICIGNFTAGGAGKTPTAIAMSGLLRKAGETPFFLSRGYGGTLTGPLMVDPAIHQAAEVGDEPLLLCRHAPTIIARDRVAGAALCKANGASVILMDDGMQNPALTKTLTLAVIDGATGIGNGLALPAGPLRMTMNAQWPLADAILVLGTGAAGEAIASEARARGKAVFTAELKPAPEAAQRLSGQKVFAFAGIGRPEKFFETLRSLGADVVEARAFPDHHAFTPAELDALVAEARKRGLTLVTTEKDLARIPAPWAADIAVLPVELFITSGDFVAFLMEALAKSRVESTRI